MVMHQLGMDNKMDEINKELEFVLSGQKKEDDQDDQLFGAAANLTEAQWKQFE